MDYQSLAYKAAKLLSQSVHKNYARGDKVQTMEKIELLLDNLHVSLVWKIHLKT